MKIHHIGYMVKNIRKAIEVFKLMGYAVECDIIFDEHREIDVCFLIKDGYRIELVASHGMNSVINSLQKKIGNSPYHICYEVDDIFEAIESLQENNFVILQEPYEAAAIEKKKVSFLFGGQIGLVELLESASIERE